jgi:hypothetical protein
MTTAERILASYAPTHVQITTPPRESLPPATFVPTNRSDPPYAMAGR